MYTRRVEVVAGRRVKVETDATPGPLTLTVSVKGADGKPAMAQVVVIEAAVDVASLDELRDGTSVPFGDKVIPIYLRGHMGGPAEIATARPGAHTACAMSMGGEDMMKNPFRCAQIKLDAGTPKRTLELQLPRPAP
jgi:hypothetical protein